MNKRFEIVSIEKLRQHPDNPRSNKGDLSGLIESIQRVGIKRNLLVVPATGYDHGCYWVIYGDRILEAAKKLQKKELPCVIDEVMTMQEQIDALVWM